MNQNSPLYQIIFDKYSCKEYQFKVLTVDDYSLSFFETYKNLSEAPELSKEAFSQILQRQNQNPEVLQYVQIIAIDKINQIEDQKIIGFGAMIVQTNLTGKVGFIENIVVNKEFSGKGIGKRIIEVLSAIGDQILRLPQIHLNCQEKNIEFYKKLGYKQKQSLVQKKI